jgi:hypothetical protein
VLLDLCVNLKVPALPSASIIVREILSSDNEDWKTWAFSFATQQGDKPYTVADLLEKVVTKTIC